MSNHHRQHLAGYLSGHKTGSRRTTKNKDTQVVDQPLLPRDNKASSARSQLNHDKQRLTIESFPNEVILKIFSHLLAPSLLCAGQVCKRWNKLANDNFLWTCIFKQYVGPADDNSSRVSKKTSGNVTASFWKNKCITKLAERRNKKAFRNVTILSEYTRLPKYLQRILTTAGVFWRLCIVDRDGMQHCYTQKDVMWHKLSLAVRWYELDLPALSKIKTIQIFSCNPLFFSETGTAIKNGPYQLSLLDEIHISQSSLPSGDSVIGSDDTIDLFMLSREILLAKWKTGDIAFICAGLHGTQTGREVPTRFSEPCTLSPHRVLPDDIDPAYGLHDYSMIVEFRTIRQSVWSEKFNNLDCADREFKSGYAVFRPIKEGDTACFTAIEKKLHFPWKTDAFKGIVQNVTWMDMILLDERKAVFHTVSSAARVSADGTVDNFNFQLENRSSVALNYQDEKVKLFASFNQDIDRGQSITHLELGISLKYINQWFGTRY
ncbi:hypothetical protein ScPMuIL_001128 [Solemya velum]